MRFTDTVFDAPAFGRCLYPIRLSAECRDRISHCLGSCGASSPPRAAGTDHWDDQDNRSECERNCSALCDD